MYPRSLKPRIRGLTLPIVCKGLCRDCQERILKDPSKLGDYNEDGILLGFCPSCGYMFPVRKTPGVSAFRLSNKAKGRTLTRIAKVNQLDYRIMGDIAVSLRDVKDRSEFISKASEGIKSVFGIEIDKEMISGFL